jgi:Xaa-Pro aminopeptidase
MQVDGMVGAVISRPEHIYYLTGTEVDDSSTTFLIMSLTDEIMITPKPIECYQKIEGNNSDITLASYELSPMDGISLAQSATIESISYAFDSAFDRLKLKNKDVGLEESHLTHAFIKAAMHEIQIKGDVCPQLEKMRFIKDIDEIDQLKYVQSLNDLAFDEVRKCLRPGIQEIEVFQRIFDLLTRHLGHPFPWQGALGAGIRSALEVPQANSTIIQEKDLVLVDIFSKLGHYYSDSTRTFVVGSPLPRHLEIHKVLEEAIERGENKLQPGVLVCEVDSAIRKVVEKAGFGKNFPHYSGHGLGLWQQEHPWINSSNTTELKPGCVITLEPGIYIAGFGGLRLENAYLITDTGPVNLTKTKSSIIST